MTYADNDTIDYFDLIVQVGQAVVEQTPDHLNTHSYLRQRMQKAWHALNSHLAGGWMALPGQSGEAFSQRTKSLAGDVAREALIVAWYYSLNDGNATISPEAMAASITEATVKSKVRL